MTPIQLYKPYTINLTIDFPSTWDELSQSDMEVLAMSYFDQSLTPVEVCLKLIENRLSARQRSTILPLISLEDLAMEYTGLVHFLLQGIDRTHSLSIGTGYSPLPDFDDTTVGAFEDADAQLTLWLRNQNPDHLISFARSWYGGVLPSNLNPFTLKAIALCFIGCKNRLKKYFPLVFSASDDTQSEASASDHLALTRLIHHSAGQRNGTREQIRKTLLKEFLFDCQLEAEKAPDVY